MRKAIFLTLAAIIAVACGSTKSTGYTVKGNIEGLDSIVYLYEIEGAAETVLLDSAIVDNGKFNFTGEVELPFAALLKNVDGTIGLFFLENSEITIDGSLNGRAPHTIQGSVSQTLYDTLGSKIQSAQSEEEFFGAIDTFIAENPASVVSPFMVINAIMYNLNGKEIEEYIAKFDPSIAESSYVKALAERAEALKSVEVGQPFIDFTAKTTDGEEIAFSEIAGKENWVLLDFWASWCGPCRAENPNVVAAYEEYKDKGFTVVGYSLDEDGEAWASAIEKDGLEWANLSDLQGWASAPAQAYSVSSIPSNFLINPEGKIAASNLRGEELVEFLSENIK